MNKFKWMSLHTTAPDIVDELQLGKNPLKGSRTSLTNHAEGVSWTPSFSWPLCGGRRNWQDGLQATLGMLAVIVFVCLFVCSFVRSFVRSFVCLFVCVFVCLFLSLCLLFIFLSFFFLSFFVCLYLRNVAGISSKMFAAGSSHHLWSVYSLWHHESQLRSEILHYAYVHVCSQNIVKPL